MMTGFQCSGMFTGMRAYLFSIMSERISRNLRLDFFESTINKDIAFFDERRTGDLCKHSKLALFF